MSSRTVMRPPAADDVPAKGDRCRTSLGPDAGRVHGGSFPCRGQGGHTGPVPSAHRGPSCGPTAQGRRVGERAAGVGRAGGAGLDPGGAGGRPRGVRDGADAARGRDLGAAAGDPGRPGRARPRADRGGRASSRRWSSTRSAAGCTCTSTACTTCPAFVPPGHGLVYLAALALGGTALVRGHARAGRGRDGRRRRRCTPPGASARWRRGRTCSARSGSRACSASWRGVPRACCTSARSSS